jgi:RimJ/RimL family protein N-acetyltransferase
LSGSDRWVQPVTLDGRFVRLEPLGLQHAEGLAKVGLDTEVWRWMPAPVTTPAEMRAFVEQALVEVESGREVAFVQVDRASGRPVGSTRYLSIEPSHRRLEIGYTWVARGWQRTAINTEAKLLLLNHAFEALDAVRVEFKTDARNEQSRRALRGIGATEEGTMRRHMITVGGRRDSVYFSVTIDDWPTVRAHLEARLASRGKGSRSQ